MKKGGQNEQLYNLITSNIALCNWRYRSINNISIDSKLFKQGGNKMRTWEMIKELTENPEKEFTRKSDGLHIKTNKYGELVWDSGYQFLRLHHEWEEIKKPVDFMTAIKSGKRIKVEHDILPKGSWVTKLSELDGFIDDLGAYCSSDIREILLNGKWYIED